MPDSASRVVHIAFVPRDDMHVKVEDSLSRCGSAIDPDVVSGGFAFRVEVTLHLINKFKDGVSLG